MEIKTDTRNDLFKRNEIQAVVEAEKNPSFEEAKKMVVEQTGKPEENLDVYGVKGSFGSNSFIISAYIYDSKEDLEKAVQKTKKQRTEEAKVAEDAKKAEVEAKKAEADGSSSESKVSEEKPAEEKLVEVNSGSEVPEEGAQSEDVPEQVEEKSEEKPTEAPAEDKPEEEAKAVEEEKQGEEEAKEN